MYSVICDGPRRFMSSVCLDCASGASPAADTRISKRGSLVLIGNSCKNRPGSGRILLAPDQLRQFRTNVLSHERTSQLSAIGGRFRPTFVGCSNACASWRTPKSSRCFPTAKIAAVGQLLQPGANKEAHTRTPEWTWGVQVCAPILPLLSFLFLLSWLVSLFLFPPVLPSS